jgi:hypothetical protein
MTFDGFTQETLDFYPRLRAGGNTTQAYNSMKHIYRDSVKPQMIELLEYIAHSLEANNPELSYNPSQDLGHPHPQGGAAKYAWGAITRKGETKHTDLQFYVALRFDYLRFGIYTKNEKKSQNIFNEIYRKINNNKTAFLEMIDALESEGIFITTKISNEESGKPKPLILRRDFPADTILRDGTFNVMTAIPIEELPNINVGDAVVDAFMKIVPLYRFVLSLD